MRQWLHNQKFQGQHIYVAIASIFSWAMHQQLEFKASLLKFVIDYRGALHAPLYLWVCGPDRISLHILKHLYIFLNILLSNFTQSLDSYTETPSLCT